MISYGTENKIQISDHNLHDLIPALFCQRRIWLCITLYTAATLAFFLLNIKSVLSQDLYTSSYSFLPTSFISCHLLSRVFFSIRVPYFSFCMVLIIMKIHSYIFLLIYFCPPLLEVYLLLFAHWIPCLWKIHLIFVEYMNV